MRTLIIRPYTRTAYELGAHCAKALHKLGEEIKLFNYRGSYTRGGWRIPALRILERKREEQILFANITKHRPDFILVIKCSNLRPSIINKKKRKLDIPIGNWWIDDPGLLDISREISPFYDFFFTNDPGSTLIHQNAGCPNVKYLTFGCDSDIHKKLGLSQNEMKNFASDVTFVGAINKKRRGTLETLVDFDLKIWAYPTVQGSDKNGKIFKIPISKDSPLYKHFTNRQAWGEEMIKIYNSCKIIINIHSHGSRDANMRVFEVTGCGAFLLTEWRDELPNLFEVGKEIVCYKDKNDLKELVKYYLEHEKEREEIAQAGQKRVYKDHTYIKRMKQMLSWVRKKA